MTALLAVTTCLPCLIALSIRLRAGSIPPISDTDWQVPFEKYKLTPEYQIINNHFSLIINTDSKEEADRLFNALSDGGQIKMQMNLTFWGSYSGISIDKFGVNWKITFESE